MFPLRLEAEPRNRISWRASDAFAETNRKEVHKVDERGLNLLLSVICAENEDEFILALLEAEEELG